MPQPSPVEVYLSLRSQALNVRPEDIGLTPSPGQPRVWGVVTDLGMEWGVATLVVFAEGTTSIYFSKGGGVIGTGTHPLVAAASNRLLAIADSIVDRVPLLPAESYRLPSPGHICFWLRTFRGTLTADISEAELASGHHQLSHLFRVIHDVITAVRMADERTSD